MRHTGHQVPARFEITLMLAAVAGAVAQVIGTAIKIGQAAGWWS